MMYFAHPRMEQILGLTDKMVFDLVNTSRLYGLVHVIQQKESMPYRS